HGRPDPTGVLVREPRVRDHRDDPARDLGRGWPGDVGPTRAPPRTAGEAQALSRVLDAGDARADRRSRRPAAVRRLSASGPSRDHASVRAWLPTDLHRHWDHRRLAGGDPGSELLRTEVDRRQDVAVHAPLHDRRLSPGAWP